MVQAGGRDKGVLEDQTVKEISRALFMSAIKTGDMQMIVDLLQNGFPLEEPIDTYLTPLLWAAIYAPDADAVQLLVQAGANLGHVTMSGKNIVHFVCRYNRMDHLYSLGPLLEQHGLLGHLHARSVGGRTPLMEVIATRNLVSVEYCLEAGMRGDEQDIHGLSCAKQADDDTPEGAQMREMIEKYNAERAGK